MSGEPTLTCEAQWCVRCPHNWKPGIKCKDSDAILSEAYRYEMEAKAALDSYDLVYPEDAMSLMVGAEKFRNNEEPL